MADTLNYLREYGNTTLAEEPFSEVDNLAICQIAYLDFTGIVPAPGHGSVTVQQAWRRYQDLRGEEGIYGLTGMGTPLAPFVLQAMAGGKRFADARLCAFIQVRAPQRHEQFAALTLELPDGTAYVAYRGTDDSLSGWREDLMLSYEVVPAQRDALVYLRRVTQEVSGRLRVGGHSKGGNLAAYATAFLPDEARERIAEVWCNDSPGFDRDVVDFGRLEAMADRTRLLTPEYSVVGSLMEHAVAPEFVTSSDRGIEQHSMMGWQTEGCRLARGRGILPEAIRMDAIFTQLLRERDLEGRRAFVDDIFGALEATGATTLTDYSEKGPAAIEITMAHLGTRDPTTRSQVRNLLLALGGEAVISTVVPAIGGEGALGDDEVRVGINHEAAEEVSVDKLRRRQGRRHRAKSRKAPVLAIKAMLQSEVLRNAAALVVGILILANVGKDEPVLGYIMVTAVAVYSAFLLVRYITARRSGEDADPEDLAIGVVTAVPAVAVVFLRVAVSAFYNLVLGGALLVWGIKLARQGHVRSVHEFLGALHHARMLDGLLAIVLGIVVLINPMEIQAWSQAFAGTYIAWHGVWGLITR